MAADIIHGTVPIVADYTEIAGTEMTIMVMVIIIPMAEEDLFMEMAITIILIMAEEAVLTIIMEQEEIIATEREIITARQEIM